MLGISFTLNSFIAVQGAAGSPVDPWLLRVALCVWEIAAPCEHLLVWVGSGVIAHLAFCIVVCGSVMRFRD
jgi:hypothetical protein